VIEEIIQVTLKAHQATLCRTSKLFHVLSIPALYRVVVLVRSASIGGFCSTLLTNPSKFAGLVQSLTMLIGYGVSERQVIKAHNTGCI
jgi:hypothetical protein